MGQAKKSFAELTKIVKKDLKNKGIDLSLMLCKLTEEHGELAQGLNKILGIKNTNESEAEINANILEEIADCLQLLWSIAIIRNISLPEIWNELQKKNQKYLDIVNKRANGQP